MRGVCPRTPPPKTRILPTALKGPRTAESPIDCPVSWGAVEATRRPTAKHSTKASFQRIQMVCGGHNGPDIDVVAKEDGDEVHHHRAVNGLGHAFGSSMGGHALITGHGAHDGAEEHALDLAPVEVQEGALGPEGAEESPRVHAHQVYGDHVSHAHAEGDHGDVVERRHDD